VGNTEEFRIIEFCAGYGGIGLGLKRTIRNVRTVAFVEIETFAAVNLVAKMEAGLLEVAPVWTDLKTFPSGHFYGNVDMLTGGFPCQPFSAAGKGEADSDPRHLFPHFKRSIEEMQPAWVFLENVEGLISKKLKSDNWNDPAGTPVLLHVLRELERIGYENAWGVFSASEVGAPHQRKRVFILAHRVGERGEIPDQREFPSIKQFIGDGEKRGDVRQELGDTSSVRPCESGENTRKTCTDKEGEERGLYEFEGTSALPGHGSFKAWPSRPGEQQYEWEPPRVVGNSESNNKWREPKPTMHGKGEPTGRPSSGKMGNSESIGRQESGKEQRCTLESSSRGQTQSPMGGNPDGITDRMGDAELYISSDNRTDELRMLGNGVVPATAERAFRVLYNELADS